jgi:hypothetical protein
MHLKEGDGFISRCTTCRLPIFLSIEMARFQHMG